ncbi:hypothetical protein VKS41_008272 [Umbelopsis sp. WA50703]
MYTKTTSAVVKTVTRQGISQNAPTPNNPSRLLITLSARSVSTGNLNHTKRYASTSSRSNKYKHTSTKKKPAMVHLKDPYHGSQQLKKVVARAVRANHNTSYKSSQKQDVYGPPSLGHVTSASTNEGNAAILAAKREGNLKAVMTHFFTMKRQGAALTHHTYNMVLDAHATLRREGSPIAGLLEVYSDMLEAGIHPTSYTYSILIRTLCKRDVEVQKTIAMLQRQSTRNGTALEDVTQLEGEMNIENALAIFEAAVRTGWAQDFETELYNQLLRTLSHYGNTQDALYVFAQLESSNKTLANSATYAALVTLYGRAGDLQGALECFQEYRDCKEELGEHDASYVYNALVDAHLKCDEVAAALKVIEVDMVKDGISVSTIPYNSVIRDACNRSAYQEAQELIARMETELDLPSPDASSYGPVLSAMCQQNDFTAASKTYASIIKTDISKSYGNLANYAFLCLSNEHPQKVFDIISDMRSAGLEPDVTLCERFVAHFTASNDISNSIKALKTITAAVAQKSFIKSTTHISTPALELLDKCCTLPQALSVVHIISPFGIRLSPTVAEKVLSHYKLEDTIKTEMCHKDFSALLELALTADVEAPKFQNLVFRIFHDMQHLDLKPNKMLCSRIYQTLLNQGMEELAEDWFRITDKLIEGRVSPIPVRRRSSTLSIEADLQSNEVTKAANRGKFDEAVYILEHSIIDQDMIPTPESVRDTIVLVSKQGNMDLAIHIYNLSMEAFEKFEDESKLKKAKHMAMNSVLIGYAQQGNMVEAKKYYQSIKKLGEYPDGNAYASLLLGSAKDTTDEATDALLIYEEAKRHNIKPTTFFYNVIISKLAKARKLENALKLFDEMQELKVAANSITYGAIISACIRAGSESQAINLFREMTKHPSYQPRVGPFNNMMQHFVRQHPDRERVLEYFHDLRKRGIRPSHHTYKLLMEAYGSIAPYDMPTAHSMLKEMEKRDRLKPQATHYASLIYSYGCRQRDVRSAARVFQEMKRANVQGDETVYQAILDTYIENNAMEEAEKLYKEMLQQGIRSNTYIENLFIKGYGMNGNLIKARDVFDHMEDDKRSPLVREPSTYEAMIKALVQNGQKIACKDVVLALEKREFPEKIVNSIAALCK